MAQKNIIITGSIGNIPSQSYGQKIYISSTDEQSLPLENIEGGNAGVMPNLEGNISSSNLFINITQSWSGSYNTPLGIVNYIHEDQSEFINGEISGSIITVSTQSLNPNTFLNPNAPEIDYIPYIYNAAITPISNFLNPLTSPSSGEIYIFGQTITYFVEAIYIKINRNNYQGINNTISLQELKSIRIKFNDIGITQYDIEEITEYPTYYLYKLGKGSQVSVTDNKKIDYSLSASFTGSNTCPIANNVIITYNSELSNPLGLLTTSSGYYTLNTTPNVKIIITASATVPGSDWVLGLWLNDDIDYYAITQSTSSGLLVFTQSITPICGDKFYIFLNNQSTIPPFNIYSNVNLKISQSLVSNSGSIDLVVLNPYLTQNFENTNFDSLMNNAVIEDNNILFMEVNYNDGAIIPSNQQQIISGSATLSTVKNYNYSYDPHINARYKGTRSTSQFLNKWTQGDEGTFGKISNVDSQKIYVAYCEEISDYTPQRESTSNAKVKYLIDKDGNVLIPNTTKNSLTNLQETFLTGENLLINSSTPGLGQATSIRNIVRGGYRLEPILYTQSGSIPNALWYDSINLVDMVPGPFGSTPSVKAKYKLDSYTLTSGNWSELSFNNLVYGQPPVSGRYVVDSDLVTNGVDLLINVQIPFYINNNISGYTIFLKVTRDRGGNLTDLLPSNGRYWTGNTNYTLYNPGLETPNIFTTIPTSNLAVGDEIFVQLLADSLDPSCSDLIIDSNNSIFTINQYPEFTPPITGEIWECPNPSNYPYIITSSNQTLCDLYDANVKQEDIVSSSFNPVSLPWSLKIGDEFRFMGREDRSYTINRVYGPLDYDSKRINPTGSIEVQLNGDLPINSDPTIFDLNKFLIRRYVDDASLIVFDGFKPINSIGPFILKPEYVVSELNKDIGEFITNLTQKNLI